VKRGGCENSVGHLGKRLLAKIWGKKKPGRGARGSLVLWLKQVRRKTKKDIKIPSLLKNSLIPTGKGLFLSQVPIKVGGQITPFVGFSTKTGKSLLFVGGGGLGFTFLLSSGT